MGKVTGEMNQEKDRLVDFSLAVRESTLKRLRSIPPGFENWQISENSMSVSEIVHHLIEADLWLFQKVKIKNLEPIVGEKGKINVSNRMDYLQLIDKLIDTGRKRTKWIQNMDENDLQEMIYDKRFGKEVTVWWLLLRGNLDHEIHHRGQLAAYLRVIKDVKDSEKMYR